MRHRKPGNRLSRPADQRKALLRALATELLRHNEIITTVAKAKALRPEVEKIITTGKDAHVGDYQALLLKSKQGDEQAKKTGGAGGAFAAAGKCLSLRSQSGQ